MDISSPRAVKYSYQGVIRCRAGCCQSYSVQAASSRRGCVHWRMAPLRALWGISDGRSEERRVVVDWSIAYNVTSHCLSSISLGGVRGACNGGNHVLSERISGAAAWRTSCDAWSSERGHPVGTCRRWRWRRSAAHAEEATKWISSRLWKGTCGEEVQCEVNSFETEEANSTKKRIVLVIFSYFPLVLPSYSFLELSAFLGGLSLSLPSLSRFFG